MPMDKYTVAQLMTYPAAGISVLQTPDGRYISVEAYAAEFYPGTVLPASPHTQVASAPPPAGGCTTNCNAPTSGAPTGGSGGSSPWFIPGGPMGPGSGSPFGGIPGGGPLDHAPNAPLGLPPATTIPAAVGGIPMWLIVAGIIVFFFMGKK